MAADKITWEQFMFCNNDARGVRYRFEDLCRQFFDNDVDYSQLQHSAEKIV